MKVFMKKAELHNIQFKKSQIQWNPITIVYNWKGWGYNGSQSHSLEHNKYNTYRKFPTYFTYITQETVIMGSHHRCFLIVKQWFPFKYYENMEFQEISLRFPLLKLVNLYQNNIWVFLSNKIIFWELAFCPQIYPPKCSIVS